MHSFVNLTQMYHLIVLYVIGLKSVSLAKVKVSSGLIHSGGSEERVCMLPSSTLRSRLNSCTLDSFLAALHPLASQSSLLLLTLTILPLSCKDPQDYIVVTWIIQDNPLILRFFT